MTIFFTGPISLAHFCLATGLTKIIIHIGGWFSILERGDQNFVVWAKQRTMIFMQSKNWTRKELTVRVCSKKIIDIKFCHFRLITCTDKNACKNSSSNESTGHGQILKGTKKMGKQTNSRQ